MSWDELPDIQNKAGPTTKLKQELNSASLRNWNDGTME
jgi:hypothetical protein